MKGRRASKSNLIAVTLSAEIAGLRKAKPAQWPLNGHSMATQWPLNGHPTAARRCASGAFALNDLEAEVNPRGFVATAQARQQGLGTAPADFQAWQAQTSELGHGVLMDV